MSGLEKRGKLDRKVEGLPTGAQMEVRRGQGRGPLPARNRRHHRLWQDRAVRRYRRLGRSRRRRLPVGGHRLLPGAAARLPRTPSTGTACIAKSSPPCWPTISSTWWGQASPRAPDQKRRRRHPPPSCWPSRRRGSCSISAACGPKSTHSTTKFRPPPRPRFTGRWPISSATRPTGSPAAFSQKPADLDRTHRALCRGRENPAGAGGNRC